MTDEEYAALLEASKPVPYMLVQCGEPASPRVSAMAVWERIAARVGCYVDSIGRASTGDDRDFYAKAKQ